MARLAARGSPYPALVTTGIAVVAGPVGAVCALRRGDDPPAAPGAPGPRAIAAVYLARGLLGIPLVLVMDGPYAHQLQGRR